MGPVGCRINRDYAMGPVGCRINRDYEKVSALIHVLSEITAGMDFENGY